jgi:TRAP transporter TAXI family solute receptor
MRESETSQFELALARPDIAWAASQGLLNGVPRKVAARNLLGTHAKYLHLITLEDRGIGSVEDLAGKRVSTGLAGTATSVKALRVLAAHGVTPVKLEAHAHLDDADAAQALTDGRIDAFACDVTLPMLVVSKLAAESSVGVRLIPTGDAITRISERHGPYYFAATIPRGTIRGWTRTSVPLPR